MTRFSSIKVSSFSSLRIRNAVRLVTYWVTTLVVSAALCCLRLPKAELDVSRLLVKASEETPRSKAMSSLLLSPSLESSSWRNNWESVSSITWNCFFTGFCPLWRRDECLALGAATRTELRTDEVLLSEASRPRDLLTFLFSLSL